MATLLLSRKISPLHLLVLIPDHASTLGGFHYSILLSSLSYTGEPRLHAGRASLAVSISPNNIRSQTVFMARTNDLTASLTVSLAGHTTRRRPHAVIGSVRAAQGMTAVVAEPDNVTASARRAHEGRCSDIPGKIQRWEDRIRQREKTSQRSCLACRAETAETVLQQRR